MPNTKNALGNINQRHRNAKKKNQAKLYISNSNRKKDIDILNSRMYTSSRERLSDPAPRSSDTLPTKMQREKDTVPVSKPRISKNAKTISKVKHTCD